MQNVGHQAYFFPTPRHDWLYKPFINNPQFSLLMFRRYVTVTFCMTVFILVSLLNGAFIGEPEGSAPNVGFQAILVGIVHWLVVYVCYEINVAHNLYVHLNPIVTLGDFFLHGTLGFYPMLVQLLAQASGATAGAALAYGIITSGPTPFSLQAVDSTIVNNASIWWVFGMEITFSALFCWVVWHNYYKHSDKKHVLNNADTMARIVALASTISFPVASITVQNPFRWLASSTISGGFSNPGSWVFGVGPVVGMVFAYLLHLVTWRVYANPKR